MWAVFYTCREDAVFLSEDKCVVEGVILSLGLRSDNNINLEEGIEDINVCRRDIALTEGRYFNDLPRPK
jgi:hypothetical protein